MATKTVNRRTLFNAARKGKLVARCKRDLTDDFAFDAANKFGRHEHFLPVRLREDNPQLRPTDEGIILLDHDDICGHGGRAWTNTDTNETTLLVHSNLSYLVAVME